MKLNQLAIGFALLAALSACNSTDLGVSGTANPPATQTTQLPTPTVPGQPATTTPALPATPSTTVAPLQDVVAGAVKMRFAPIIGAPVDKVTPLSRRISARAKEQAITIVASTDLTATHVFKGYFSLLQEGTGTTIIYVFDVLDPTGNRLHRIQGQETVPTVAGADPWASVPPATMETIADKTMADFKQWLATAK